MQRFRDPAPAGVRFLHTADLQLGMPFHNVPGDPGAKLRERRLDALDRLGEIARAQQVDFVLVAGDFFDANTANERLVQQVFARVRRAAVLFLVLPGNHDHGGTRSIYTRPDFRRDCPENLVILQKREPYPVLEGRAVLLPAPLYRQRELGDPTAHLTPDFGAAAAPGGIRIGVAHGSVLDVGRDVDGRASNLIPTDRAERGALDYLALGDWHGRKRIPDRAWYSGAPEPTSFRQNDSGGALLVEIAGAGAAPSVQPISVATTCWLVHEETVTGAADVERLERWFDTLDAPEDTLLDLTLEGTLLHAEMGRVGQLLERMAHRLLHLKQDSRIRTSLTDADLAAVAVDGTTRTAIDRLRALASSVDPRAPTAQRALVTLHRLALIPGASSC